MDLIERGYAYAIAKRDADMMAFGFFQAECHDKDSFGIAQAIFLLSRLLANAN